MPTVMLTPAPIRTVLDASGVSNLMWNDTFSGDISNRKRGLSVRQIIRMGL